MPNGCSNCFFLSRSQRVVLEKQFNHQHSSHRCKKKIGPAGPFRYGCALRAPGPVRTYTNYSTSTVPLSLALRKSPSINHQVISIQVMCAKKKIGPAGPFTYGCALRAPGLGRTSTNYSTPTVPLSRSQKVAFDKPLNHQYSNHGCKKNWPCGAIFKQTPPFRLLRSQ